MPTVQVHAFTIRFKEIVRVLQTEVGVSTAYDPHSGGSTQPLIHDFVAVWDTGASDSAISARIVEQLKLASIDVTLVNTANGERLSDTYLINVYLPNKVAIPGVRVIEGDMPGTDVLIGMDIIGSGDFAVTHHNGHTCMTFQLPAVLDIDFVSMSKTANDKNSQAVNSTRQSFGQARRNKGKRKR